MEKANVDRICTHMNDDHGLSVYAMAMRSLYASGKAGTTSSQSLSKISLKNAKLSDISLKDYTLSYVYCNGDVCSMERVTVPFQQPFMTSPSDARIRMKEEHERVLTPMWSYLYLDPIVWIILIMTASVGYAHVYGLDGIWDAVPFGCSCCTKAKVVKAITGAFYFTIVAHSLEAMYVSYLCRTQAKVSLKSTLMWVVMICLTGYPLTSRYFQLMGGAAADADKKKKAA
jgi:hypothetical protein